MQTSMPELFPRKYVKTDVKPHSECQHTWQHDSKLQVANIAFRGMTRKELRAC